MEAYKELVDLLDSWSDDPMGSPQARSSACQHWLPLLLAPHAPPGQAAPEQALLQLRGVLLEAVAQQLYVAAIQLSCQGLHSLTDHALRQLGFRARLSDEVWSSCREAGYVPDGVHCAQTRGPGADVWGGSVDSMEPAPARERVGTHTGGVAADSARTGAAAAAAAASCTGDGLCPQGADGPLRQPLVFDLLAPGTATVPPLDHPATGPNSMYCPEPQLGQRGGGPGPAQGQVVELPLLGPLLPRLQAAFAPDSPFWYEHSYQDPSTPYFSYSYCLRDPPGNIVELAAQRLLRLLSAEPRTRRCMAGVGRVEWWAHRREPGHPGHQLHFDVDERRLRQGLASYQLLHPALSSVLFLSGPPDHPRAPAASPQPASAFGPTLVLDQTPSSPGLAARAWAVHPATGRFLVFPGDLLHGVLPAAPNGAYKGTPACQMEQQQKQQQQKQQPACQVGDSCLAAGAPPDPGPDSRVTLMLAWWADAEPESEGGVPAAPARSAGLGPCMAAPLDPSPGPGDGGSCKGEAPAGASWPRLFAASGADLAVLGLGLPGMEEEGAEGPGLPGQGAGLGMRGRCEPLGPREPGGPAGMLGAAWHPREVAAAVREVSPAWSWLYGPDGGSGSGSGPGSGSGFSADAWSSAAAARSFVEAEGSAAPGSAAAAGGAGQGLQQEAGAAAVGEGNGGCSGQVFPAAELVEGAGARGEGATELERQLHGAQLPSLRFFVRSSDEFRRLYVPDRTPAHST